jgi:ubiquinone/menaquinone biosynthesis C-methylase UbiE/uncharacterized protein YbaR (Trm112 family)
MLDDHVHWLRCPVTRQRLKLLSFESTAEDHDGEERQRTLWGLLYTEENIAYPIVRGIPRLLPGALRLFDDEMARFAAQLADITINPRSYELDPEFEQRVRPTLESFEVEWRRHRGRLTWGQTVQDRIDRQRQFMGLTDEQYPGKLFLDAGAGTGEMACAMAVALGADVIGVDLTSSIERGELLRRTLRCRGHILFVQADLSKPLPFQEDLFDFIYSNGVLHHTPDTKASFENLVPFNKVGGKLSVWLYRQGQDDMPTLPYLNVLPVKSVRKYTRQCNKRWLHGIVSLCVSVIWWFIYLPHRAISGKHAFGSRDDLITIIYDAISPPFAHIHTPGEVTGWFRAHGYHDVFEGDQRNPNGFNVCGTKGPGRETGGLAASDQREPT